MSADQNTARTKNLIKWEKGQSGNPGGRPKGAAAAAREAVGNDPKALIQVLFEIAHDSSAKANDRIAAAREILDRGWGKSASYTPVEDGDPLELSDVSREVAAVVDELAARRPTPAPRSAQASTVVGNGKAGTATA